MDAFHIAEVREGSLPTPAHEGIIQRRQGQENSPVSGYDGGSCHDSIGGNQTMSTIQATAWKREDPIDYIQPRIPAVHLPSYAGQRYEVEVPDTLDLQERAARAVHGLSSCTDPQSDYEIYWLVYLKGNRPVMRRDYNHQVQLIMQEGLALTRLVSGSDENLDAEKAWLETLFHLQGPDGLLYYPQKGRPWIDFEGTSAGQYDDFEGDQYTGPLNNGVSLGVLALYYRLTGEQQLVDLGMKLVDGMARQAVHRDDYAFNVKGIYGLGVVDDPESPIPSYRKSGAIGWAILNIVLFYEATGYAPALTLAGELSRYLVKHGGLFEADGSWIEMTGHFPWHTGCLLGLLEYATVAEDAELTEFVRISYEFGKDHGNALMGWFPEHALGVENELGEICGVALMLNLAVKLTQAGVGDYWDDIDRWVRNQFIEGQLTDYEWMYTAAADEPAPPINEVTETDDNVGARNIGNFAGWPSPNDFFGSRQIRGGDYIFMHCCAESGPALYRVWKGIVDYRDGMLRVNLLLNRGSPWADVDSYIPYEGRVDVKIKQACDLSIRIPEWVEPEQVSCRIDDQDHHVSWDGRYAVVGRVQPRDIVTLSFPIFERTDVVHIQGRDYTLIRKGNDVVRIDPPGQYCPLYQRAHYRENQVRWRGKTRFVPDETIEW